MKLTEPELQEMARQLRCPDGQAGVRIGEMMNVTNSNIIKKTIEGMALRNGDTILEIGPGNGSHVKDLGNNNVTYQGIDISATMVEQARMTNKDNPNATFHVSDGNYIPFSVSSFDKVFTTNTIYFWEQPQQYATEIARVLKHGGILSVGFIPKSTMIKIPFAKFGFTLYDIPAVSRLLEAAGLNVIQSLTGTELVLSNSGEQIEREFVILTAKKYNFT